MAEIRPELVQGSEGILAAAKGNATSINSTLITVSQELTELTQAVRQGGAEAAVIKQALADRSKIWVDLTELEPPLNLPGEAPGVAYLEWDGGRQEVVVALGRSHSDRQELFNATRLGAEGDAPSYFGNAVPPQLEQVLGALFGNVRTQVELNVQR